MLIFRNPTTQFPEDCFTVPRGLVNQILTVNITIAKDDELTDVDLPEAQYDQLNSVRLYPPMGAEMKGVIVAPNPHRIASRITATNSFNDVTEDALEDNQSGHLDINVALVKEQIFRLHHILRSYGFAVVIPPDIDSQLLIDCRAEGQIFNRDTLIAFPQLGTGTSEENPLRWVTITTKMNQPGRQLETPPIEELAQKLCSFGFCNRRISLSHQSDSAEGGDILPWYSPSIGTMTLNIGISERTSVNGANSLLQAYAGNDFAMNPLLRCNMWKLNEGILHLDCALGSPAPGVLVINPTSFEDFKEGMSESEYINSLFEKHHGVQCIVTVPEEERYSGSLATNFERLGNTVLLYPLGYPLTYQRLTNVMQFIAPQLPIQPVDLSGLKQLDGAARCATQVIVDQVPDIPMYTAKIIEKLKSIDGVYFRNQ